MSHVRVDAAGGDDALPRRTIAVYRQLGRLALIGWSSDGETSLTIEEPAEKYLLWLPLSGGVEFCGSREGSGHRIGPGWIGAMTAAAETRCTLDPGSWVLALLVPQTVLVDGIGILTGSPVAGRVTFDDNRLSIEHRVGQRILRSLELADSALIADEPAAIVSRLEEVLVLSMLTGLPHSFTDVLTNDERAAAPGTVAIAEAYIRQHASEPITVRDIAKASGCSIRTIQLNFRRFRKTTPMNYLRRIRLERIYEALIEPNPGTTVAAVAADWRFSNLRRLTNQFHRIYGETPYNVLKRGHRLR